jgi:hypothetical protein
MCAYALAEMALAIIDSRTAVDPPRERYLHLVPKLTRPSTAIRDALTVWPRREQLSRYGPFLLLEIRHVSRVWSRRPEGVSGCLPG